MCLCMKPGFLVFKSPPMATVKMHGGVFLLRAHCFLVMESRCSKEGEYIEKAETPETVSANKTYTSYSWESQEKEQEQEARMSLESPDSSALEAGSHGL